MGRWAYFAVLLFFFPFRFTAMTGKKNLKASALGTYAISNSMMRCIVRVLS